MAVWIDGTLHVDNSTLSSYASCPTKAMITYGFNLKPRDYINMPMRAGTAIHLALELYTSTGSEEKAFGVLEDIYRDLASQHEEASSRLSFENVKLVLESWFAKNEVNEPAYTSLGEQYSEFKFNIPFFLNDINYVGAIDELVARSGASKPTLVLDTKSTGRPDATFRNQFWLSPQISGYVWASRQYFEGIVGAVIRVIHVASVPTSERKCYIHKVPYYECGFEHLNHEILPVIQRTDTEIGDWIIDAQNLAREWYDLLTYIDDDWDKIHEVPQTGKFKYQECARCEHRNFCRAGRPVHMLESSYIHEEWRPGGL